MILTLDSTHKNHLEKLGEYDAEICVEFCRLASTSLITGDLNNNRKLYRKAASRLSTTPEDIGFAVEAIIALFKLASCKSLSRQHLSDSLVLTRLPQSIVDTLVESYGEIRPSLYQLIRQIKSEQLCYNCLEWRLGAIVASRTVRSCMKPTITLAFTLMDANGSPVTISLSCSLDNLRKLRDVAEEALLVAKSQRVRKVARMLH